MDYKELPAWFYVALTIGTLSGMALAYICTGKQFVM